MTRKFQVSTNESCLTYNNFKYYKSIKLSNGHTLWKCSHTGCKSELKTNTLNTRIVQDSIEHNHNYVRRGKKINSTPNGSHISGHESHPSISPIRDVNVSQLPTINSDIDTTSNSTLQQSCNNQSVTEVADPMDHKRMEALLLENEALRRELSKLRGEWDAAVSHSIEVDTKLLLLTERETCDASCQTDIAATPTTASVGVQTDIDSIIPNKREVSVQTSPQGLSSPQTLTSSVNYNVDLSSDPPPKLKKNTKLDVHRLLTDDEIVKGTKNLCSKDVDVLHPAVCLNVRLSADCDVKSQISPSIFNKTVILAPISNAEADHTTGLNTPGTHWSLVVINLERREYYHLDSIPHLNDNVAKQFCRKINVALNFNPFTYKTIKCKRQKDSYSCGRHVINNAIAQVNLLQGIISKKQHNDCTTPLSVSNTNKSNVSKSDIKPKVILIGDSHARSMASYLQPIMPQCQVIGYCYPGAAMTFVLDKLELLIRPLQPSDYVIVVGGSNNTSASHLSKVVDKITNICTSQPLRPNVILTEIPHILVKSIKKRKEIVKCNNTLYYLANTLKITFIAFGLHLNHSHYECNGQHFNNAGKRLMCNVLGEKLKHLLKLTSSSSSLN